MNQQEYFKEFQFMLDDMMETTQAKNTDYAKAHNAFANFEQIEVLSGGSINVEQGILVRMSDKMSRIANLLKAQGAVKEESIDDTLKDLAVYATILRIYRSYRLNKELIKEDPYRNTYPSNEPNTGRARAIDIKLGDSLK